MKRNKATIIWVTVVVLVLGGLFVLPRLLGSSPSSSIGSGVPCLVQRAPVIKHIHPQLTIVLDGEFETIPSAIGNNPCLRQIHTHDRTGQLHVEPQGVDRDYTLEDFFRVWGKSLERDGYSLEVTVGGKVVTDPSDLLFQDGQRIVAEYTEL